MSLEGDAQSARISAATKRAIASASSRARFGGQQGGARLDAIEHQEADAEREGADDAARARKTCIRMDIPAVRARISRWAMNATSRMRPMAPTETTMSRIIAVAARRRRPLGHPVADAAHRLDHGRVAARFGDLAPEALHVAVDGAIGDGEAVAPHAVDELARVKTRPGAPSRHDKQIELDRA